MLASEYFNKCNEETKHFIEVYLSFMSKIFNNNKIKRSYRIKFCSPNIEETSIYYFFLINMYLKTNFGLNMCSNGAYVDDYFTDRAIRTIYDCERENFNDFKREMLFNCRYDNCNIPLTIVKAYANEDEITIESIISNLLKEKRNHNLIYRKFRIIDKDENILVSGIDYTKPIVNNPEIDSILKNGELFFNQDYNNKPLIGREQQLRKICVSLLDDKKSLILCGEPGVGKRALLKGIISAIKNCEIPELNGKKIIELSLSAITRNSSLRGELENNVMQIIEKATNNSIILAINDFHNIIGLGKTTDCNLSVAEILKPYLAQGKIKIIGITTPQNYKFIASDSDFASNFEVIQVPVLSNHDILSILKLNVEKYNQEKNMYFGFNDVDEMLNAIIKITNHQSCIGNHLNNPEFALTILRKSYNIAKMEGKSVVDTDSLIEAITLTEGIAMKEPEVKSLIRSKIITKNNSL